MKGTRYVDTQVYVHVSTTVFHPLAHHSTETFTAATQRKLIKSQHLSNTNNMRLPLFTTNKSTNFASKVHYE